MPNPSPHLEQDLPTGTVTFLFTDIEASTRLLQQLGDRYADVLAEHQRLLRSAFKENGGHEVDTQGDAFFVSFASAKDAVNAAIASQKAITGHPWPDDASILVRMGLHTGEPLRTDTGYVGMDVHRSARICSAGHGGQILLSQATRVLVENDLPEGVSLGDLGEHRLKDLQHPERISQLLPPDSSTDFLPLKSLDNLPNNLPLQLTSFIGREKEIPEVKELLAKTRLLTLTGSGGCGKTRLALQVVADLVDEFPDGAWVVELASLSDPGLVTQETASVLGVREGQGVSLLDSLSSYLKSRQTLLLLNNCEHLIEACITLTDTLLRACPNLKILVASREALSIAGESTYKVPSLSLPNPKNTTSVENLTIYEAVRLFIDRAAAAVSTFTLTDSNALAVAQICHRLDGIPLAIELAAARIKVLSAEEIMARLDDRFRLLTGGSRTALPRQQTLRAAIDWSYNLLSEEEGALINRLSVFMGGWTLAAAEVICSGQGIEDYEVLDLLTNLVEKSLVVTEEEGGKTRYHLLETVRQYARDKLLESGESESLRNRHLDWYLELAERAEPELEGHDQIVWKDRLELELDNLRTALEWSLGSGEEVKARQAVSLRLAGALGRFWAWRDYYSEGREWMETALSKGTKVANSGASASTMTMSARAKTLYGAGLLAWAQGDHGRATTVYEESLALYQELEDKQGIANSLNGIGWLAGYQGDYSQSVALGEEALTLFRELDDKQGIARSLGFLGNLVLEQGDYERAIELGKESLALQQELGKNGWIILPTLILGRGAYLQGDYERAAELFEEHLELCRESEWKRGIAVMLFHLGAVVLRQGNYGRAAALFEESLTLSRDLGDKRNIVWGLEGLARLAAAQNYLERAGRLLGAAEAIRGAIGFDLQPSMRAEHEESVATVRAGIGEEEIAAEWAEGRKMTLERAVEYALEYANE